MIQREKIEAFIKMADLLAEAKAIYEEIQEDFGICDFANIQLCPEIGIDAKAIFNEFASNKGLDVNHNEFAHDGEHITKDEIIYNNIRVFVYDNKPLTAVDGGISEMIDTNDTAIETV